MSSKAAIVALGLSAACSTSCNRPFYRYRTVQGSPLTPMLQVMVAAFRKRNRSCPTDPSLLYEIPKSDQLQESRLNHTDRLRFLDKAAMMDEDEIGNSRNRNQNPWRLTTVTQVEELKLLINMIPIWLTSLIFGIGISQGSTFFIKQGNEMNRRIYKHFELPPASSHELVPEFQVERVNRIAYQLLDISEYGYLCAIGGKKIWAGYQEVGSDKLLSTDQLSTIECLNQPSIV